MKVAIASENKNENSEISARAGRAPFYLIFEGGNLIKVMKNPFSFGGGGAGWGVAKMLGDYKVDLVIAENFGENMKMAFKERKINFEERKGNIKNFIDEK